MLNEQNSRRDYFLIILILSLIFVHPTFSKKCEFKYFNYTTAEDVTIDIFTSIDGTYFTFILDIFKYYDEFLVRLRHDILKSESLTDKFPNAD